MSSRDLKDMNKPTKNNSALSIQSTLFTLLKKKTLPTTIFRIDIIAFSACVIFFLAFPFIDLKIASLYFNGEHFIYGNNSFVRFVYDLFARIHIVYLLIFIGGLFFSIKVKRPALKSHYSYLLLSLILGPGLLVNTILKDNTLGRPRPVHIQEFNAEMKYVAPFVYSGECKKNCSFVSGHAAIGFFLMAMAWIRQRRIWLVFGVILGAFVGYIRIVQGGHFLSDVVFAGWFTYFTYVLIARFMGYPFPSKWNS